MSGENINSRDMHRIKKYLVLFKGKTFRGVNNPKTPKSYQILHIVDYVKRYCYPINYDSSRGENFGKSKIKDNAKFKNKKLTLKFYIRCRIFVEDIVNQISTLYYQNVRY